MDRRFYLIIVMLLVINPLVAQVGIGTVQPNSSSQLHIDSNDKGVLFPQVPLKSRTDQQTISNGNVVSLFVYNTSNTNDLNPGYYYWDGNQWLSIGDQYIYTDVGAPTPSAPNSPNSGAVYVDESTGNIYTFDGTNWINQTVIASNGLNKSSNAIKLGGELTNPTVIKATTSNILAIEGLDTENIPKEILVIDPSTGILKKSPTSNLFKEEVVLHVAENGQTQFETPLFISDAKKVNVYRNGVRIDFTKIDNTTIALEQGVSCFANDEIRIVQFN